MSLRSNIPAWSYGLAGIVFPGFLVFLFAHICFGYDEYLWKTLYERNGFTGFFRHVYDSLSFRYSTHFYLFLTFHFSGPGTYRLSAFVSQSLVFSILVLSLYAVFRTLFRSWLGVLASQSRLLISAVICSAALYFLTSQLVEIYTYTSSFYSYFMPMAFFVLGLSIVISDSTHPAKWFLLLLASFSVGGAAENASASCLACLGAYSLFAIVKNKFNLRLLFSDRRIRKLFVFEMLIFLFALIAYTAPGATNRAGQEATNLLLKSNALFAPQHLPVFLGKFFHLSNLAGLLLLGWFIFAGSLVPAEKKELVKKILLWSFVSLLVSLLIHLGITRLIFGSYGYLRIWFPVNFQLCMFAAALMLYAGTRIRPVVSQAVSSGAALTCLLFLAFYIFRHYPNVLSFSEAYFARRQEVLDACTITPADKTYTSKKLPEPDILYFDKFVRFPTDSLSTYFCVFNEIPCKNVYIK